MYCLNWMKFNEKGIDEKIFRLVEIIKKKKKITNKIIKISLYIIFWIYIIYIQKNQYLYLW